MKTCNKCRTAHPLSMFHKDKSKADGLRSNCKVCKKQSDDTWRSANRDRMLDKMKEYHRDNADVIKARSKQWYADNTDKAKAYHSVRYYDKPYAALKEADPDYVAKAVARNAVYRARRLQATPSWLNKSQVDQMKEVYVSCKDVTLETGVEHHVDHIVPLQGDNVCGLHVPWNLRVLEAKENMSKGNKHD